MGPNQARAGGAEKSRIWTNTFFKWLQILKRLGTNMLDIFMEVTITLIFKKFVCDVDKVVLWSTVYNSKQEY